MIEFDCPQCKRHFTVPDDYVGRKAKCKGCGQQLQVPAPSSLVTQAGTAPKIPMRTRRLLADAKEIEARFATHPIIRVLSKEGDPAEKYVFMYDIRSFRADESGQPAPRSTHHVEINLGPDYPRLSPHCRMLTPIFHPNIDETTICIGDHWTAGERLADLVIRIGEMIAFQAYNIQSPLNAQAAMWADLNTDKLPTDTRDMHGGK